MRTGYLIRRVLSLRLLFILVLLSAPAFGQSLSHALKWCEVGGVPTKQGPYVQASHPSCTVDVYGTGTVVHATIYSDNLSTPTPLANPFTALSNGTISFYAAGGCYDIVTSGGTPPFPAPYTYSNVCIGTGGGGGSGGTVNSVGFSAPAGFLVGGSPVTVNGTLALSMPTGWTSQDLLVGSGANAVTRLAKGANGTCLTMVAGLIAWGSGPCVGVPAGTTNLLAKYTNGAGSALGNSTLLDDGTNPVQSPSGFSVMSNAAYRVLTNANPATTVFSQLVQRNASGLAINATVSSSTVVGVAGQGAGVNSGLMQVSFAGYSSVLFDNQTVINHFAIPSTTTAGFAHDAGATKPVGAEVIGTITSTNSGVGTTAIVDFFTGDTVQAGSGINTCATVPGSLAYYQAAQQLSCDVNVSTDGSGNLTTSGVWTLTGTGAGFLYFTASTQPTFGVANSAYFAAPTSIPTTYAMLLPSAQGTAGQYMNIASLVGTVGTMAWTGPIKIEDCGTTTVCAKTVITAPFIVKGTVALSSGTPSTATLTALPFTSTSSYVCTATEQTTAANNLLKIVNASASSTVITGPNTVTDVVNYSCVGS